MIPSNILPGSLFWITFLSLIFIGTDSSAQAFRQDTLLGFYSGGGIPDTIIKSTDAGSGASSSFVLVKSAKAHEEIELGYTFWYYDFTNLLSIPSGWDQAKWQPFHPIVDSIFGFEQALSGTEPDFQWLLAGYKHRREGDSLFSTYYTVPQTWNPMPIARPTSGWYHLEGDKYALLGESLYQDSYYRQQYATSREGWLRYNGHNHFLAFIGLRRRKDTSYQRVWVSSSQALWQTAHGLIWQKGDQYTWLFTSSGSLTGGPQKLRWSSLYQIEVIDGFVLVQHVAPVVQWNQFLLIDPQTGAVGVIALDEDFKEGHMDQYHWERENGQLRIERKEGAAYEYAEVILDWGSYTQHLRQIGNN